MRSRYNILFKVRHKTRLRHVFPSFVIFLVVFSIIGISGADAHSLFNSAEQTIGSHRMQIATLPEFPQVGEESQILFRFTDDNLDEVEQFTMGIRVFYNGQQIQTFAPQTIQDGHWKMDYVFEKSGNHLFRVDVYNAGSNTLTYTFNMSTQSPFGYVFFFAITIGAITFAIVIGYIYLPRMLKKVKT